MFRNEGVKILFLTLMTSFTLSKVCTRFRCEKFLNKNMKFGFFSGYVINDRIPDESKEKEFDGNGLEAVKESECVKKCIKKSCRAIAVTPVDDKKVKCSLSKKNIHQNNTIHKKGSKIIALGSPACQSSPCQNGGSCQTDDDSLGFTCQCLSDFLGKKCEQPAYPPYFSDPTNTISFNDYRLVATNNTKATFKLFFSNGKVVTTDFAKSPVYMVDSSKKDLGMLYMTNNMPFLSNPLKEKNLTIGCWIRIHDVHTTEEEKPYNQGSFAPSFRLFTLPLHYVMRFGSGKLEAKIGGQDDWTILIANVKTRKGKWYHVGMRVGSETFEVFMNGDIVGSKSIPKMAAYDSGARMIEVLRRDQFKGIVFLDEIKVFNDVKSDKFIRNWYKSEKRDYI